MTSRFALLALLAATGAVAAPVPYTPPTVGSGNTAIADPVLARPATTPCRVRLFTDQPFADFSPKFFSYAPPAACPGPWQKVVLEATYSVEVGRRGASAIGQSDGRHRGALRSFRGAGGDVRAADQHREGIFRCRPAAPGRERRVLVHLRPERSHRRAAGLWRHRLPRGPAQH